MALAERPTREGIRTAPEGIPRWSLGWKILEWCTTWLTQPDGEDAGEPWVFTAEQARFILWWYAVDERGRFVYRYGMLRRQKGWGKDPVGAVICIVELIGPCRFSHWDPRTGNPVGKAHTSAWVQIVAVSKYQTGNTMNLIPGMIPERTLAEFEMSPGIELWYAHGHRCRLEAVASSWRSLEGGRPTFVLKNETHHWRRANDGLQMSRVIKRNLAKSRDGAGRALAISNAHSPGEESDAERDFEIYTLEQQGAIADTGMLYDSLEAPDDIDITDLDALRYWIEFCRGDSTWADVERTLQEFLDTAIDEEADARRFYLNQLASGSDRYFNKAVWDACLRPSYRVRRKEKITLGFDGSMNNDWTPLIATEISTGHQWPIGIWVPQLQEDGNFRVSEHEVDQAVQNAFADFEVVRMFGDPYWWSEYMSKWAGLFNRPGNRRVISWPTVEKRKVAVGLLHYKNAMRNGEVTHNGDPMFSAGIYNAHRHEETFIDDKGDPMYTIRKERADSDLKIDPAMAGMLSWLARLEAISAGADAPADFDGIYIPTDEDEDEE